MTPPKTHNPKKNYPLPPPEARKDPKIIGNFCGLFCSDGTFLDFYSDYHPDLYGDMAITAKPKTVDPQK